VAALLSLFALDENTAQAQSQAPLSGVTAVLSMDDSPRVAHP
jgi:hypothetical protein